MNAKELIEAAKSVVEHKNHTGIKDYAFIFAEHILATVREDDDEPVTPEWLESQGIINSGDADDCQHCYIECEDGYAIQIFDGPERCVTLCDKKPTRGQLRKLLEALGVK